MKSTAKFVEIMEELAGVSVGAKVVKEETSYEVSAIDLDSLDATITLTTEAEEIEDITISLKDLVESEEYVIEKKACEEEEEDDMKDDDKKKDDEEEEEEDKKSDDEEEEDDMDEKKKK